MVSKKVCGLRAPVRDGARGLDSAHPAASVLHMTRYSRSCATCGHAKHALYCMHRRPRYAPDFGFFVRTVRAHATMPHCNNPPNCSRQQRSARLCAPGDRSMRAHAFSIPALTWLAALLLIASAALVFWLVHRVNAEPRDDSLTRAVMLDSDVAMPRLRDWRASTRTSNGSAAASGCCMTRMRSVMNTCAALQESSPSRKFVCLLKFAQQWQLHFTSTGLRTVYYVRMKSAACSRDRWRQLANTTDRARQCTCQSCVWMSAAAKSRDARLRNDCTNAEW